MVAVGQIKAKYQDCCRLHLECCRYRCKRNQTFTLARTALHEAQLLDLYMISCAQKRLEIWIVEDKTRQCGRRHRCDHQEGRKRLRPMPFDLGWKWPGLHVCPWKTPCPLEKSVRRKIPLGHERRKTCLSQFCRGCLWCHHKKVK